MEVAVLRDFAQAQCFSFVLIRHSQSCWLQGWHCCEIMSLIKRPVWYSRVQSQDTPGSLKSPPPPRFHLFPLTKGEQGKNRVAWSGRAAHFISSLATLTHLRRWKTFSVIFEATAAVAEQHKSSSEWRESVFCEIHTGVVRTWNAAQYEKLMLSQTLLRLRRLRPVLRTVGHSQRARLNNWSMNVQWKQKHSLALYSISPLPQ